MTTRSQYKIKESRMALSLSPLSLLVLSACGGGQSNSLSNNGGASFSVVGNAIKGPLFNALVGLDYDGDGIIDSGTVRSNSDGSYSLSTSANKYTIIAVTDNTTIDTSSNTILSGVTLKAPQGASVVTPTTTLIEEGSLSSEEVASVLGLPEGVDPISFNPYGSGVDTEKALAVEIISQQVMSVITAFSAAAEGAGASESAAFKSALNSVVEVVKTKAGKLSDLNASASDKTLDLKSSTDLQLIKVQVKTAVGSVNGINTTAFNALVDDTTTAIKNVNNKIGEVTDLNSDNSKNIFSITEVMKDQVKAAITSEVSKSGTGNITFIDANIVKTAAQNKAPTNIKVNSNSINEAASSLVIGKLSTVDSDQNSGAAFTYKLAEIAGSDFNAFGINQETGELYLKAQPDFETKSSYNLTIISIDEGGKKYQKSFNVSVTDANEKPHFSSDAAISSIAEGADASEVIYTASAIDPDKVKSIVYSISGGADKELVQIDSLTGEVTLRQPADRETNEIINFSVTASDASDPSLSSTQSVTITVTEKNDLPEAISK